MNSVVSRRLVCFTLLVCLGAPAAFAGEPTKDNPSRSAEKAKSAANVSSIPTPAPMTAPELYATGSHPLPSVDIMPLSEVKRGMRGVAYTVFEGVKPEEMGVEIMGVLKNMNGPKSDMILARLHGEKVEYTGVVAGMSGSPVYINGKLVGAIAFRMGQFSKEPLAGITPIEDMLEINEMDRGAPVQSIFAPSRPAIEATRTSTGGEAESDGNFQNFSRYLTPIGVPLVFNGFSEAALRQFAPEFASAGVRAVMGAGAASDESQPEPIEPGSAVSAILVRGDMNIAATCTVTYADAERLLACGHPLMQAGKVELPMTKATVVATLPSPLDAFKIVNTTETIGAFLQDRHTGIMGRFGKDAGMIPVTLTVRGGSHPKQFRYEVLNSPKLTPVAMMATVFNALFGLNEYGEEATYTMNGRINVRGYPSVELEDMFAPSETAPTALAAALSLGSRFGRIFDNAYEAPGIQGVELEFDVVRERRWARMESARTDVTEARPGEEILVEAVLRPYRGERMVRLIPVRIPTSTPKGDLRILISDGDTLNRMSRASPAFAGKMDLNSTIAALNKERVNHRLYVSLLQSNPQAMIEDKVMPTLPLSVINVLDGMRGTQEMVLSRESAVNESSLPLDFVVSGAQVIVIKIK